MEAILKEINAVVGVIGSFVCLNDGSVAARATPESIAVSQIELAARVASQTFLALEASGQMVQDFDLTFDKNRLFFKNLERGILAIICARNVNIPLLNLTANAAVKKIAAELKVPAAPAPQVVTSPTVRADLPALVAELEQEAHRVIDQGKHYRLRMRLMNEVAIWLTCPHHHNILVPLVRKHYELGGFGIESDSIEILFEQLGYTSDRRFAAFFANKRLRFTDTQRDITAEVFLDQYLVNQSLDLIPYLTQEEFLLPITALALARMQLVEMSEAALRDLCAMMLEHDLSVGEERGKIDAAHITRLCADDWGWFKTVSLNLDRVMTFANTNLPTADRALVSERSQRLKHSMDSASKSLRWQARARLGESVKWYETPLVYRSASARPDLALG